MGKTVTRGQLAEHAVALAEGDSIGVAALPSTLAPQASEAVGERTGERSFKEAKQQTVRRFEESFLGAALRRNGGNVTRTADEIGMYRQQLQAKLAKLGLDPSEYAGRAKG